MNVCAQIAKIYDEFKSDVESLRKLDFKTHLKEALQLKEKIEKRWKHVFVGDEMSINDETLICFGDIGDESVSKWKQMPKMLIVIEGKVDFEWATFEDTGNLRYVAGDASFMGSAIRYLTNLREIGGSVHFENSEVERLGALSEVGGNVGLNSWSWLTEADFSKINVKGEITTFTED